MPRVLASEIPLGASWGRASVTASKFRCDFKRKKRGEVGDMRVHVSQGKEGTVLDHRSLIAPTPHNIYIYIYILYMNIQHS